MPPTSTHRAIRPAGYSALIERFDLSTLPNWHRSRVTTSGVHKVETRGGEVTETYPPSYWPGDDAAGQLAFALKYDGNNLAILASLFRPYGSIASA